MGAEADAVCGAEYGVRSDGADQHAQRVPAAGVGHPGRHDRAGDPETAYRAATSRTGCWSGAAARRPRWYRWWPPPTCWACRPGGWRSWSRRSASAGCRSRRSARWPRASTSRCEAFRTRPLDAGPYTFVAADALVLKVREGRAHGERARTAGDRGERRRLPGDPRPASQLRPRTAPAGWRSSATWSPAACPGSGWSPATRTRGLVDAIGATLPGASLATMQNALRGEPDGSDTEGRLGLGQGPAALASTTNPTPTPCTPSSTASWTPSPRNSRHVAEHLDAARTDILAFTAFPKAIWRQIWSQQPAGAVEPRDPPPHRRCRHLPRPRRAHPPRRRRPRRAARRCVSE